MEGDSVTAWNLFWLLLVVGWVAFFFLPEVPRGLLGFLSRRDGLERRRQVWTEEEREAHRNGIIVEREEHSERADDRPEMAPEGAPAAQSEAGRDRG
jgi:hypothetical protein